MKKFKIGVLMITFIFMNLSLFLQTYINSGPVYDGFNGNWTSAGSPYIILGDIYIPGGQTLTIYDPYGGDIEIQFYNIFPNNPFKFEIDGTLNAIGNYTSPTSISFEPFVNPDPYDIYWSGIIFNGTSGNSIMKYCHIINTKDKPSIEIIDNTNITGNCIIDSCLVEYGYNAPGIEIKNFNPNSTCHIIGNIISNITGAPGLEIDSTAALVYIDSNYVRDNTNNTQRQVGGIYIYRCPINTINNNINIKFNHVLENTNTEPESAGGILCDNSSPYIHYNTILNNESDQGAGILCRNNSAPEIDSNIIYYNVALERGGAISITNNSNPIIQDNDIELNSAGLSGGGINISESCSPIIFQNTISVNVVYDNSPNFSNQRGGGGISIVSCDTLGSPNIIGNANINGNIFEFNQSHATSYSGNPTCSGMGGCICISNANINVTVQNNSIKESTADNNGGGFYIINSPLLTEIGSNNYIDSNIATDSNGAGIYINNSYVQINNNLGINNNKSRNGLGGGVFLISPVGDFDIFSNHISYNYARYGGGLFAENVGVTNNNLKIRLNYFEYDSAFLGGGGIFTNNIISSNGSLVNLQVTNNLIDNNYSYRGGGIYFCDPSYNIVANNNTIANNFAYDACVPGFGGGGGIWEDPPYWGPPYLGSFNNDILWGNSDPCGVNSTNWVLMMYNFINFWYSDIEETFGSPPPNNNINFDPQFNLPTDYQLHLTTPPSPCIDFGYEIVSPLENFDLIGNKGTVIK